MDTPFVKGGSIGETINTREGASPAPKASSVEPKIGDGNNVQKITINASAVQENSIATTLSNNQIISNQEINEHTDQLYEIVQPVAGLSSFDTVF